MFFRCDSNLKIFFATFALLAGSNSLGFELVRSLMVLGPKFLFLFVREMFEARSSQCGVYMRCPERPARLAVRLRSLVARWTCAASLLFAVPLFAQVQGVPAMEFHGVPASGIGGTNAGFSAVRPNAGMPGTGAAFGCCAGFFFPSSFSPIVPYPHPSVATGHRARRGSRHRRDELGGMAEPVYIPYAVPYEGDSDDAEAQDDGVVAPAGGEETGRLSASRAGRTGRRRLNADGVVEEPEQKSGVNSEYDASGDTEIGLVPEAPPDLPEPVVAQPKTVLIFKDGHRSEVVNYAIVGDTLFDFSGDRSHKILISDLDIPATKKANDALGVEFGLPPPAGAASSVRNGAN